MADFTVFLGKSLRTSSRFDFLCYRIKVCWFSVSEGFSVMLPTHILYCILTGPWKVTDTGWFFFLCLSRILWKKNEVADYEATTFSIFYNNTLFLVLVIVASFFLLKNFNPTVYPFNHTVYVICTNNIWDGSFTHTVLLWLYMASVLKCLERSLLLWYTWVIWAHKFRLHSEGRCGTFPYKIPSKCELDAFNEFSF